MKEKKFINTAIYPGGKNAIQEFIKQNLSYPKEALNNQIEGNVIVKYKVDPLGNIINTSISKGIGYGCEKEAIRVVKKLKYPKHINKKVRVTTSKKITIKFRLPKLSINYTITT
tara:strand:+ start:893 stop:1234 length:342 start_codon:yes stop_codon:yes gene_type:complete